MAAMALPASSTLPPPNAMTISQPCCRASATPCVMTPISGSRVTENIVLIKPCPRNR